MRRTALALTALLLVGQPAAAQAAPAPPPPTTVAELRLEVTRVGDRLAAATLAWEQGQQRLGELVSRKISSEREADQLAVDARAATQRAAAFASNLYRNPTHPLLLAVLSGNARSVSDIAFSQGIFSRTQSLRHDDLTLLSDRARRTQQLLQTEQAASSAATALQRTLEQDLASLQLDAVESLTRLQAAVEEVRRREAAAAAAALGRLASGSGATCDGSVPTDAINGFLPPGALCALVTAPGQRLIAPAAAAFERMSAAFRETFGTPLCVTDSYRDYAGQVEVFRIKPNLAATPGRSQHGWGRAVDLCGGVQRYGSAPYVWLKANAGAFGFQHPDWAEPDGSRPEPWHWEFPG